MMTGARADILANGRYADDTLLGSNPTSSNHQEQTGRVSWKTLLVLVIAGCSGSGSAPLSPPPNSVSVQFWEDPNLSIRCHIHGSDGSDVDRTGNVMAVQPAPPVNPSPPAGFRLHSIDVPVVQGVGYYMTVNRDDDLGTEWDYNWSQDDESVWTVKYGSSPFGN